MRAAGAFAGVGIFEREARDLGLDVAWTSEVDERLRLFLHQRHPEALGFGDITTVNARSAPEVELLMGGSPCQGFSIGGLGKGLDDPRSGLFGELMRVRDEFDPEWLLWENVPGTLTSNKGEDFANVLAALVGASEPVRLPRHHSGRRGRYAGVLFGPRGSVAWRVVSAENWVPQRRERIIAVAHRGLTVSGAGMALFGDLDLARGIPFSEGEVSGWLLDDVEQAGKRWYEPWETLDAFLDPEPDPSLYISARGCAGLLERIERRGMTLPPEFDHALRVQAGLPSLHRPPYPRVEVATTLRQREGKPGGGKGPLLSPKRSLTLATGNDQYLFERGGAVRKLSVTEGERLMGMEPGWTEPLGATAVRWRAIGNAVVAPMAAWALESIVNAAYRLSLASAAAR